MNRAKQHADDLRGRRRIAAVIFSILVLGIGRAAAQSAAAPQAEGPDGRVQPHEAITADEEVTVIGKRSLRDLRLEVQAARERVYDLFNSLNIDDEFDIHCKDAPRTGTRIPQRICRPQYTDNATHFAGREFLLALFFDCGGGLCEQGLATGNARAQAALSEVPGKDHELAVEVQRLARENPEFRRAILSYDAAERRYDDARLAEASAWRISVSIIDPADRPMASSPTRRDAIALPEAIELGTPDVPADLGGGTSREGWVKLRYSVLADGTMSKLRIVDTMPPGLDASEAIAAAQAWTFEPATDDGIRIDWHNNLAIIVFQRRQSSHEGSLEFAEAYADAADLIARERYAEARSVNERMQGELAVTLEEMAFAQMQLAAIDHALGDPQAALAAIRRATEPSVPALEAEELKLALEHRFALELELGLAVEALETYERRAALGRLKSRERMARLGAALEQALDAPQTSLAAKGRLDAAGHWEHTLTWRTLAVDEVEGRNDALAVQCNRNGAELPLKTGIEMTIPDDWGQCVLLVTGRPGTTFVVYEFRKPGPGAGG